MRISKFTSILFIATHADPQEGSALFGRTGRDPGARERLPDGRFHQGGCTTTANRHAEESREPGAKAGEAAREDSGRTPGRGLRRYHHRRAGGPPETAVGRWAARFEYPIRHFLRNVSASSTVEGRAGQALPGLRGRGRGARRVTSSRTGSAPATASLIRNGFCWHRFAARIAGPHRPLRGVRPSLRTTRGAGVRRSEHSLMGPAGRSVMCRMHFGTRNTTGGRFGPSPRRRSSMEDTYSYRGWLVSDSFLKRTAAVFGYALVAQPHHRRGDRGVLHFILGRYRRFHLRDGRLLGLNRLHPFFQRPFCIISGRLTLLDEQVPDPPSAPPHAVCTSMQTHNPRATDGSVCVVAELPVRLRVVGHDRVHDRLQRMIAPGAGPTDVRCRPGPWRRTGTGRPPTAHLPWRLRGPGTRHSGDRPRPRR